MVIGSFYRFSIRSSIPELADIWKDRLNDLRFILENKKRYLPVYGLGLIFRTEIGIEIHIL
jgi:hypothetical protein